MDHSLIACSLAWRAPPTDLQKKYTTDGLIGISNCQISSSEKPTSRCFCQKSVVWTRKTSSSSAICASMTSWSARTPCVLRRSSTRGYSRYAKDGQCGWRSVWNTRPSSIMSSLDQSLDQLREDDDQMLPLCVYVAESSANDDATPFFMGLHWSLHVFVFTPRHGKDRGKRRKPQCRHVP